MNLSLGVYDIFANAIPGSLYLLAGVYVSIRLGWLDVDDLLGIDTTVAIIAVVVASYLLGQILAPGLRNLVERVPLWRASSGAARREFMARNPAMAARPFVNVDPFTLLAALRQESPDAAVDADRSRATGIMLRSASPAFVAGVAIALLEAIATRRLAAVAAALMLAVLAVLALREGQKFSRWAHIYTLECAAWLPEVDTRLATPSGLAPEER